MLLPCPHCRRRFTLHAERIRSDRARIECPACRGAFVVNLVASSEPDEGSARPTDSRRSLAPQFSGGDGKDALPRVSPDVHGSSAIPAARARPALDTAGPRFLLFWTLVPACCLLLALSGILLSGPWMTTEAPPASPFQAGIGTEEVLSSSVSSHPDVSQPREGPSLESYGPISSEDRTGENLMARLFWSTLADPKAPCEVLLRSRTGFLETEDHDTCQIYPLWIAYLILETAPTPACEPETTFALAADALQKETLCGPGHAFLCAYYLKKGLLDRSQSFLDQALLLTPDNPWVRMVEAVFFEQAYYDDQKSIGILEDLSRQHPSFSLARYLLGKAYLREEEYREAHAAFASLKEDARGQIAFWRIRRALSSLQLAADQSAEKAQALLALSRAFTSLKDYPMAQDLYRWIFDEMPGKLPKGEQTAAYCELGGIYEKRGDNSSAYDAYRDALEIDPDFPAAREGIRNLLSSRSDPSGKG